VQSEASRFRASSSFRDEILIGLVWALLVAKGQLDLLWKESAADELLILADMPTGVDTCF
jgi:hypothetical protein